MTAALLAGTAETENAVANGDTRTLSLFHEHTKEAVTVTFKRDGRYDRAALDQLSWLLRDWREAEATKMDPRLFDVVWEAQRSVGSSDPLHVVCGYRSPKTNGMLRRRSRAVAEFSQHMLGKAMDFYMTDASIDQIRAAGMRLQRGGVGWYPHSGSPFVHLDVGSVRSWPRMTHDQLARLFPDGKTVHLPTDNRPLSRYDEARAEILARGGSVLGVTAVAEADEIDDGPGIKGFLAGLFGGSSDPAPAPAAAPKTRMKPTVAVASADPEDAAGVRQALAYAAPAATEILRDAMLRREGRNLPSVQAVLTDTAGAGPTIAPLPPRRPTEFAAVAAALTIPLPPARAIQVASLEPVKVTGMANAQAISAEARPVASASDQPRMAASRDPVAMLFEPTPAIADVRSARSAPVRLVSALVRRDAPLDPSLTTANPDSASSRFAAALFADGRAPSRFSGSSTAPPATLR